MSLKLVCLLFYYVFSYEKYFVILICFVIDNYRIGDNVMVFERTELILSGKITMVTQHSCQVKINNVLVLHDINPTKITIKVSTGPMKGNTMTLPHEIEKLKELKDQKIMIKSKHLLFNINTTENGLENKNKIEMDDTKFDLNDTVIVSWQNVLLLKGNVKNSEKNYYAIEISEVLIENDLENKPNIILYKAIGTQYLPGNKLQFCRELSEIKKMKNKSYFIHLKYLKLCGEFEINDKVYISEKGSENILLSGVIKTKKNCFRAVLIENVIIKNDLSRKPKISLWNTVKESKTYESKSQINFPIKLRDIKKMKDSVYIIHTKHLTPKGESMLF